MCGHMEGFAGGSRGSPSGCGLGFGADRRRGLLDGRHDLGEVLGGDERSLWNSSSSHHLSASVISSASTGARKPPGVEFRNGLAAEALALEQARAARRALARDQDEQDPSEHIVAGARRNLPRLSGLHRCLRLLSRERPRACLTVHRDSHAYCCRDGRPPRLSDPPRGHPQESQALACRDGWRWALGLGWMDDCEHGCDDGRALLGGLHGGTLFGLPPSPLTLPGSPQSAALIGHLARLLRGRSCTESAGSQRILRDGPAS
mmetsp:Transcript_36367/g.103524  ORF Transcript_36367/g.103524 Transcript_36367/m.103524 type:complete len:261 (+) Transcript_36367:502-1284(+)